MPSKIEISHKTILFTVFLLIALFLVFQIRDILFLFFISIIIMSAIRPLVEKLEGYRIPRVLSILCIYVLLFGIIGFTISQLLPPLVTQTGIFISHLPNYGKMLSPYYQIDLKAISSQIAPIGENIVKVTVDVFSNIVTSLTVLVFTFYLLLERKNLSHYSNSIFSSEISEKVVNTIVAVEYSLGSWLRGQFLLMVFVGVLSYVGLLILRIEFALPLAIIAGMLEIIPMIGPVVSGIPAVLVASTMSPLLGLATVALYFLVQQVENHLFVPMVMNRAVGLPPLLVIISLMIGSKLGGTAGAIIAIPIVVMVRAGLTTWFLKTPRVTS